MLKKDFFFRPRVVFRELSFLFMHDPTQKQTIQNNNVQSLALFLFLFLFVFLLQQSHNSVVFQFHHC